MTRARLLRHRLTKGAATDRSDLRWWGACSLLYPIAPIALLLPSISIIDFQAENNAIATVWRVKYVGLRWLIRQYKTNLNA